MRYKSLEELENLDGEEFEQGLEEHRIFWIERIRSHIRETKSDIIEYEGWLDEVGLSNEDYNRIMRKYKDAVCFLIDLEIALKEDMEKLETTWRENV